MNSIGDNLRRLREAKGLTQGDLSRLVRISQASIDAIERGVTARSKYLPQIAVALGVPLAELDPSLAEPSRDRAIPRAELLGDKDLPVYASAEGGSGQIIIGADPVDFMPRPAPLAHVKASYGLYLTGDSMVPEFWPGDVAMVNPALPIISDVPAILYAENDGEARAMIKRVVRVTAHDWHVRQWNPPEGMEKDFVLDRGMWTICHRVIGKYARQ